MWKIECGGRAQVEQAVKQFLPPCQVKCPINEDIQRTNVLISLLPDEPNAALEGCRQIGDYLYDRNPLFTVCGYVCGLCELECNYSSEGGAIRRRLLKRFISDSYTFYLDEKEEFDITKNKENVAVVGGGPAGLMCAFDLSKRGYRVTLYEATGRLGGALWLIPQYRLPEKVLNSALLNMVRIAGIDVKYNTKIGEGKLTLDKLKNEGYKAVFMCRGTPTPRVLTFGKEPLEGQDLSGVMFGHDFLYEVSHGNIRRDYFNGQKVVVIGGGNVAFDVARTARRMGAEVALACLECEDKSSKDGIPADHEEIKGAWEEGIQIFYSRGVKKIQGESGVFKKIECPKCTSVFDEGGFNPKFDLDDTITINGDVLIITVGQGPDKLSLEREGLLDEKGRLAIDPLTLQSKTKDWIYIGGDVRKIGFMVEAMRDGVMAAESIERYLRGLDMREGRTREYAAQEIPMSRHYKHEPDIVWIPPEKRMHFQLFERGFTLKEAKEEAKRCLTCGPCISCKACLSIGIQDELPTVTVHEDRCSGCGICVSICYYSAALMKRYADHRLKSTTDMFQCKACGMCVVACPTQARELIGCDLNTKYEGALAAL
jgi:NADPH-dependent glutamate synthase beta subunit-like oxidoreductase